MTDRENPYTENWHRKLIARCEVTLEMEQKFPGYIQRRDARIVEMRAERKSISFIARCESLSRTRVYEILRREESRKPI